VALLSMTGFGRGEAAARGIKVEVELSAVNRRQFDVNLNLPRTMLSFEAHAYDLIHKAISRGYVRGVVRISASETARTGRVTLDFELAKAHVAKLRKAAIQLGLEDDLTASSLLRMPDVLRAADLGEDGVLTGRLLDKAMRGALAEVVGMRRREGAALEKDIVSRLQAVGRILERIRVRAPKVPERYREVLQKRLQSAGVDVQRGDNDIMKQLALFADRADISEEIIRLDSHLAQAGKLIGRGGAPGRALDFLCQEMFREINTVGSKANDARISRCAVNFKTELERLREQVQNVE